MNKVIGLLLICIFSSLAQADAIILRTVDSGVSWSQESSSCNEDLNDVAENCVDIAVAVGENGTILRRNNSNWSDVSVSGISDDLHSVMYAMAGNRFYAAGDNGVILYSEDDGLTWQIFTQAPMVDFNDLWIDPTGGNALYVCGANGAIYKFVDPNWIWVNSGTTNDLYAFAGHICSSSPDYALGNFGICYDYNTQNASVLGVVSFRGATEIASGSLPLVAVGSRGGIYRRGYSGPWYSVNSGTTMNLFDVAYMAVDGQANCDVYCAVGSRGTILRSTDTGQTWSNVFSGTTRILRGVSSTLLGDQIAYIVGETNSSSGIALSCQSNENSVLEVTASQSGTLSVRSGTDSQISVVLFDLTGRTIDEKYIQIISGHALVNFTAPRGVYLYSVSTGANVTSGKLIISE